MPSGKRDCPANHKISSASRNSQLRRLSVHIVTASSHYVYPMQPSPCYRHLPADVFFLPFTSIQPRFPSVSPPFSPHPSFSTHSKLAQELRSLTIKYQTLQFHNVDDSNDSRSLETPCLYSSPALISKAVFKKRFACFQSCRRYITPTRH